MEERSLEQMRQAVDQLRQRMDAAARQAGRSPAEVQLCAACKTHPAATVAASAGLAIDLFGENHVQELCANFDAGPTATAAIIKSKTSSVNPIRIGFSLFL